MKVFRANWRAGSGALALATALCLDGDPVAAKACKDASRLADNLIGAEVGARARLQDGDEFALPLSDVLDHGRRLFGANWTVQEGGAARTPPALEGHSRMTTTRCISRAISIVSRHRTPTAARAATTCRRPAVAATM